jgi:crossover junction endodeoxyribonuclease RusA
MSDDTAKGLEPDFPIEFLVEGTPVSLQSGNAKAKEQWKERVRAASGSALPDGHWVTYDRIAVTIYYFPAVEMQGDVDNIVKLILDALKQHIFSDDSQVDRVVVQKFEPGRLFEFALPSPILEQALRGPKPVSYIRVSTSPFEELA